MSDIIYKFPELRERMIEKASTEMRTIQHIPGANAIRDWADEKGRNRKVVISEEVGGANPEIRRIDMGTKNGHPTKWKKKNIPIFI